jgi:hypothetical protein
MKDFDNPLLRHIRSDEFEDPRQQIVLKTDASRLRYSYHVLSGGWKEVKRLIATSAMKRICWFPDTNIAILPEAQDIWTDLRIASLGNEFGIARFTSAIYGELQGWLENPLSNQDLARQLTDSLANGGWIRHASLLPNANIDHAILAYTRLLAFRRSLANPGSDGLTLLQTDAKDKLRTMGEIQKQLGERVVSLAKKGRDDRERAGVVYVNDEFHVLQVIRFALESKRHCVILTADSDYREIFQKAQWFIDTHYRASSAAFRIAQGSYGKPYQQLDAMPPFFEGQVQLYSRPTTSVDEVLPHIYEKTPVSVVQVAPNGVIHHLSFVFETPMLSMFETRGKTDGRVTDALGEANIHVDLGPLKVDLEKNSLGVGIDTAWTFESGLPRVRLSMLDLELSLVSHERHTHFG